ncbi:MAG: hypothetical protein IPO36_18655 [Anaerolineales bacterium]|nr:hypothetical protein [Anaerolineales bacterium]
MGESLGSSNAPNEVVVARGQNLRPVRLTASVDDRRLTSYVADGRSPPQRQVLAAWVLKPQAGPFFRLSYAIIFYFVPIAPHLCRSCSGFVGSVFG